MTSPTCSHAILAAGNGGICPICGVPPEKPLNDADVIGLLTKKLKPESERPGKPKKEVRYGPGVPRVKHPTVRDVVPKRTIANLDHEAVVAELCRRSLSYFVRQAWKTIMPGIALHWNWHLEQICKHVQAMLEEWIAKQLDPNYVMRAQNLVINCPPRSLKSTIVSICASAWMWLRFPTWKSIFVSANPSVAIRDARGCKALLEGPWYQGVRGCLVAAGHIKEWHIDPKHNADGDFANTLGGTRLAMGFLAVVVGLGGDAIFVDDPNDMKKVHSEPERARICDTWDLSLCNRVNSYTDSVRIMIMQRGHELDLTGHWKASMPAKSTVYIAIPLEYDPVLAEESAKSPFGYQDPRTILGENLHPARFTDDVIAMFRTVFGPYGFAGQMNQRPAPQDGGNFDRKWWNFCELRTADANHTGVPGSILLRQWRLKVSVDERTVDQIATDRRKLRPNGCDLTRPTVPIPFLDTLLISVDATFGSTKETSSRVSLLCIGIKGADRFVLEDRTKVRGFLETVQDIRDLRKDFPSTNIVLVEKKANGAAVIESLQHEISGIIAIEANENWAIRANAMLPSVAAGNWYLLEGASWAPAFVGEFGLFPNGAHDDRIDAASQVNAHYATGGYTLPDW